MSFDQIISHNIRRHGLHVQAVLACSPGQVGWAYTIGLWKAHRHPEVVTSGLPPRTAQLAFNEIARSVKKGARLRDGDLDHELFNSRVMFREVPPALYGDEVGLASRFYRGRDYPLLQLVWPDVDGRWPWEAGYIDDPPQDLLWVRGGTRGHGRQRAWA